MALFLQSFMMINQQRKINAQNESLLKGTLTFSATVVILCIYGYLDTRLTVKFNTI